MCQELKAEERRFGHSNISPGRSQPKLASSGPPTRRRIPARYGGQPPREPRAEAGEPRRNRTYNPQIKSLLLCQLS
jgi:hypothetical protein